MTCLLLGAVLLGNLGVTVQVPSSAEVMLAPPTRVRFDSVDYKNILRWTPPTNSTTLQYYVQWKIYGEPEWFDVDACQGIQRHHCDLSDVTSDPREWYYARVLASSMPSNKSAWVLSPRFNPRWDSKLSPPVLRLNITEKGIVVRVKPPKHIVRQVHRSLQYRIYRIHSSGKEELFEMDCCFNKLTLKDLNNEAKYCLQAETIVPLQGKTSTRGSVKCVSML